MYTVYKDVQRDLELNTGPGKSLHTGMSCFSIEFNAILKALLYTSFKKKTLNKKIQPVSAHKYEFNSFFKLAYIKVTNIVTCLKIMYRSTDAAITFSFF